MGLTSSSVDLPGIRQAVDTCLEGFLARESNAAAEQDLSPIVTRALHGFLFAGGKRLPPSLELGR